MKLPLKAPAGSSRSAGSPAQAVVAVTWLTSSRLHVLANPRPLYLIAAAMIGYNLLFYKAGRRTSTSRRRQHKRTSSSKCCWTWFR